MKHQPQLLTSGKIQFYWHEFKVEDFPDEIFFGRRVESEFAQQLLAAGCVIEPIIATHFEGKFYLIDGRRRVLTSRYISSLTKGELIDKFPEVPGIDQTDPADFSKIYGKVLLEVNPNDQALLGLVLNEQRSDNLIFAWA